MDGRDIGQTVFPNAELKIFMVASDTVRAQRRFDELQSKGIDASYKEVLANLRQRDQIDQTRACDPMRKAPDALELDNSEMTPAQQMEWVLPIVKERIRENSWEISPQFVTELPICLINSWLFSMIRDFWVENYLSIGERQSIDFRSKTKADYLTCEVAPGVFLNKLGIFLGSLHQFGLSFMKLACPW